MFNPWQSIRNFFRGRQFEKLGEELKRLLGEDPDKVETFLEVLLGVMSLVLWVDEDYYRNIQNFRGKYLFRSKKDGVSVYAIFKRTWFFRRHYLKVREGTLKDADVTVTFKNSKALMNLLLSPKLNILESLLQNDVTLKGNLNYIFKLGFMATELQQMLLPGM